MAYGDVVRVTQWNEERMAPYGWAILTEDDDDANAPDCQWVLNSPRDAGEGACDVLVEEIDVWEIASPDDWPDEVCAAVAKAMMERK